MKWAFWRKKGVIPVAWSELCGCFEHQLQRRYMNGLFPPDRRRISTAELIEAKAKDAADVRQLQTEIEDAFGQVVDLPPNATFKEALRLREAVEKLILRSAQIGLIANEQRDALRRVYNSIVQAMRESCPAEHIAELEHAFAQSETFQRTWTNNFLAQMNRKDTPILAIDVVPSLLTEDVETVRLVASTLNAKVRKITYDSAVALVAKTRKEDCRPTQLAEKLRALKDSLSFLPEETS